MTHLEVPQRGDQAEAVTIRPDDLLALMFDRMPMGILVLDRDLRIVRFNPTWANYFKHYNPTCLEALREGAYYFDVLPDHRPDFLPLFEQVLQGEPVRDPALRLWTGGQPSYWNVVFAPLSHGDVVEGLLAVGTDVTEQVRTHEALQLAVDELRQINTQVEQRVEERTRELSTVLRVQQALTSSLNPDEVLQLIADEARSMTGGKLATVALPEGGDMVISVLSFDAPTKLTVGFRLPMHDSVTGLTFLTGETQRSHNVMDDDRVNSEVKFLVAVRSMLSVPLRYGSRILGVISVASDGDDELGPREESFLNAMAPAAAIALQNARLYQQAGESAVAAERGRLARDLHDSVTQTLFSATLTAEVLPRLWQRDPEEGASRLEKLRELTRGALAEMRTLLLELRPAALTESSLGDLLHQLARGISSRTEIQVDIRVEGQRELPAEVQIALYRIAQEALNNVAKHSGASHAQVDLTLAEERITLNISDNGCGFDPWAKVKNHYGLRIMSERAVDIGAQLRIETIPGHGTQIFTVWTAEEN